jgi:hypothetical protein
VDEEREKEEALKNAAEGASGRSSPTSAYVHLGSTEGEEETPTDKKRRRKENIHKKKNDASKKK